MEFSCYVYLNIKSSVGKLDRTNVALEGNIVTKDITSLPVVLYWCETWFVTLREEHRVKSFDNRVLRGIFRPNREEVTGGWRELHNEQLHNLYSSPSIIINIKLRNMKRVGHVA
jgi:hypothetical protein